MAFGLGLDGVVVLSAKAEVNRSIAMVTEYTVSALREGGGEPGIEALHRLLGGCSPRRRR